MRKQTSFLFLFMCIPLMLPEVLHAQIDLHSSGYAAMGVSPSSTYKLRVEYNLGGSTRVGVRGATTGAANTNYGIQGIASSGYTNYGVYGSASGGFSNWAGYFSGSVYTTGSYQSSDERLKKNIQSLNSTEVLARVLQLRPVSYEFLTEEELKAQKLPSLNAKEGIHIGLLAEELEAQFPELVTDVIHVLGEETGEIGEDPQTVTTKAVNYTELTIVLLAAVQELKAEVEALKEELAEKK